MLVFSMLASEATVIVKLNQVIESFQLNIMILPDNVVSLLLILSVILANIDRHKALFTFSFEGK